MTQRIGILGGGITGLALAWYLTRKYRDAVDVTILERSERCGGWIQTTEADGFVFEHGPRSCRTRGNGIATLELARDLGVDSDVVPASSAAKQRYLYVDGALQALPSKPWHLFTHSLMAGVPKALWREWRTAPGDGGDETIASFFRRRFGDYVTDVFVDPLTSGIYAGDIDKLSVLSCFPRLVELEQRAGSVLSGMLRGGKKGGRPVDPFVRRMLKYPIFSFRGGMQTLVDALRERVSARIVTRAEVGALAFTDDEVSVTTGAGDFRFDRIVCTTPPGVSSQLLEAHCPEAAGLLDTIPSSSCAVVNMGYRKKVLPLDGFGYLIPTGERENILGCVWDSSAFPALQPNGTTVLTVMIGGTHDVRATALPERELVDRAIAAVGRHAGVVETPDCVQVSIARNAIPQYRVGHSERIARVEELLAEQLPRVSILGSGYHGVAVNDCIATARDVASTMLEGTEATADRSFQRLQ